MLTRARPGAQNARSLRADLRRPREHRTTAIFQRGHFKRPLIRRWKALDLSFPTPYQRPLEMPAFKKGGSRCSRGLRRSARGRGKVFTHDLRDARAARNRVRNGTRSLHAPPQDHQSPPGPIQGDTSAIQTQHRPPDTKLNYSADLTQPGREVFTTTGEAGVHPHSGRPSSCEPLDSDAHAPAQFLLLSSYRLWSTTTL